MAEDEKTVGQPLNDPREQRVLLAALNSYRQYRSAAHYNITHLRRQSFYSLSVEHLDILCEQQIDLPGFFRKVDSAIDHNADIAEAIYHHGAKMFDIDRLTIPSTGSTTPNDVDKAQLTIKQLYRDWSIEGAPERDASYSPILAALATYLPAPSPERHRHNVLVPGAGLGRLVFEMVNAGYTATGNEISYHQMMASSYILNAIKTPGQHMLHPWVHSFSNHRRREDQLQQVLIPDVLPGTMLATTSSNVNWSQRMFMVSGDFCVLYKQPEYQDKIDAVTTCFFIDTAPNVIHYIETVKHCLRSGGLWINHGPLQWHFECSPTPAETVSKHGDVNSITTEAGSLGSPPQTTNDGIGESGSFELTDTEIQRLLARLGFEVLETKVAPSGDTVEMADRRLQLTVGYVNNPRSMLQTTYRPSFWVARKL